MACNYSRLRWNLFLYGWAQHYQHTALWSLSVIDQLHSSRAASTNTWMTRTCMPLSFNVVKCTGNYGRPPHNLEYSRLEGKLMSSDFSSNRCSTTHVHIVTIWSRKSQFIISTHQFVVVEGLSNLDGKNDKLNRLFSSDSARGPCISTCVPCK